MTKRQRKQAKKKSVELVTLTLDPAERRMLESIKHPSQTAVEDGFHVGTGALGYGAPGEPPPAITVVAIAEVLAAIATEIEAMFVVAVE